VSASPFRAPRHVRRVLESLVAVVCPPEAVELGLEGAIVDHAEQTMGALPALFRAGLLTGLTAYDQAARVWPPARGKAAHDLPLHLRSRWYLAWLGGLTPVQRELAKAVKQVLVLGHYEQAEIQERLGYRPQQWIDKVKKKRLEVYSDEIARHEASILAPDPLPRPGAKRREVA
jgi:hypothetical protein